MCKVILPHGRTRDPSSQRRSELWRSRRDRRWPAASAPRSALQAARHGTPVAADLSLAAMAMPPRVVGEIEAAGGRAGGNPADVGSESDVAACVHQRRRRISVSSAAWLITPSWLTARRGGSPSCAPASLKTCSAPNVFGAFLCSREAASVFHKERWRRRWRDRHTVLGARRQHRGSRKLGSPQAVSSLEGDIPGHFISYMQA